MDRSSVFDNEKSSTRLPWGEFCAAFGLFTIIVDGICKYMDVIDCIKERRSTRKYMSQRINKETQNLLLSAAVCAPSVKNGQPWRFKCIDDEQSIKAISRLSVYRLWMQTAPLLVAVFLDRENSYDYVKDVQSCGAAIQNMLLAAKAAGIGSCWIGEILSKQGKIKEILKIDEARYELMGIVAFGYPNENLHAPDKKEMSSFLI